MVWKGFRDTKPYQSRLSKSRLRLLYPVFKTHHSWRICHQLWLDCPFSYRFSSSVAWLSLQIWSTGLIVPITDTGDKLFSSLQQPQSDSRPFPMDCATFPGREVINTPVCQTNTTTMPDKSYQHACHAEYIILYILMWSLPDPSLQNCCLCNYFNFIFQ